jgi:hypothetical protein
VVLLAVRGCVVRDFTVFQQPHSLLEKVGAAVIDNLLFNLYGATPMSAAKGPFGFRAAYHPTGLDRPRPYTIQASYATQIAKGDPVAYGATTALGTVIAGPTSGDLLGTLVGVQWIDSTGKPTISNNWPGAVSGATSIIAWVMDQPDVVYETQTDGTFAVLANVATASAWLQGVIGAQMNCVNVSAANATTGISTAALAGSTVTASAQAQFRVLEPGQQVDNNYLSDQYVIFQVALAQSVYIANKVAV